MAWEKGDKIWDQYQDDVERGVPDPVMTPSGRVMYLHWEYSELAHAFSRNLFTMNPDGASQRAHYGSNSVWPNALFSSRVIPGQPNKFIGIVCGHHSGFREGEMVLFDVTKGRHEADGFAYGLHNTQSVGGVLGAVGIDGPWDIKRILMP